MTEKTLAPTGPPEVTPPEHRRTTCPTARFGRHHVWVTGAFYWPLNGSPRQLYIGEDYVMCGACGQIGEDR